MAVSQATANATNSSSQGNSDFARGVTEFNSITLPTSAANAIGFDYRGFSGGSIEVDGACTITWYRNSHSKHQSLTQPIAACDEEGAAIPGLVFAAAGEAELPISLFGKPWIYPVATVGRGAVLCLKK